MLMIFVTEFDHNSCSKLEDTTAVDDSVWTTISSAMLLVLIQLYHCNKGLLLQTSLAITQLNICLYLLTTNQIYHICASSYQQDLW